MNLIKKTHLAPLHFLLLNGAGKALLLLVLGGGVLLLLLLLHGSGLDVLSFVGRVAPMLHGVAWLLVILTRNPPPPWQCRIAKGCGVGNHSQRAPSLGRTGILTTADGRERREQGVSRDATLLLCFEEEEGEGDK